MGDYNVDFDELDAFARQLDGIGDDIVAALQEQTLAAISRGMKGGTAAQVSSGQVSPAFAASRRAAEQHLGSHATTLAEVARAYLANEDDAQTAIRGFYEGRY